MKQNKANKVNITYAREGEFFCKFIKVLDLDRL